MALFSERYGYRESRTLIQRDDLDDDTRIQIWNAMSALHDVFRQTSPNSTRAVLMRTWIWYFRGARDEYPGDSDLWISIKSVILSEDWTDVFDAVEAVLRQVEAEPGPHGGRTAKALGDALNRLFEQYLVGYRLIGNEVTPLDSNVDAEAVTRSQEDTGGIAGARHALEQAVEHLADRQNPDYPNSIKESISAVEAVVKKLTGKGELSKGLAELESAGLTIHPALKSSWVKMYGWTSDEDGIRHGGIEVADADQALAKYMLIVCSAFVSYLIEEGRKKGLV